MVSLVFWIFVNNEFYCRMLELQELNNFQLICHLTLIIIYVIINIVTFEYKYIYTHVIHK